ncbi:hypothetical protein CPB83DRAFT_819287 [Crepidotus variabilis]|uniref:SnoaL-like domain-containing protein n=1 Tax=Crepidotus variabilis TaxID=179855 RepID=A0A9P6JL93_9AGAR|nr:hypothetical protein CPB83DRAFT_819287 [Crepidotus variabilis]
MTSSATFNPSKSPNYGFLPPESPSPNLQAFLSYISAVHTLDTEVIIKHFDDSLEHRIIPNSLGRPVLNKKQYAEYVRGAVKFFKWVKLTINQVIEADDILTAHLSSVGESICGTPYSNELVLIFHYVPAPSDVGPDALPRVHYAKEFVDSATITKFYSEERVKMIKMEVAKQKSQR